MSQVFHILKKDARCFSAEIAFLLAVSVASAWMQARNPYPSLWFEGFQLLTIVAAIYLIARVVHAEALDGDTQFWITRPYRWKSLLAAKLAFIGVFAGLPVFFTHAGALALMGFSPGSWLAPLATANIRLLTAALLAATLASVTKGMTQYSLLALLALGGGASISETIAQSWTREMLPHYWPFLAAAAATVALGILLVAYRARWTFAGRVVAVAACLLWAPLVTVTPAKERPVTDIDEPKESASVGIKADGIRSASSVAGTQQPRRPVSLAELTISVRGVPDGLGVSAYRLAADFQGANGATVSLTGHRLWEGESQGVDQTVFKAPIFLPQSIEGDRPGVLRISFQMQLVKWHTRTVTLARAPIDVFPGLQCYLGPQDRPVCRAPGRWPSLDVRVVSEGRTPPLGSPFMSGGFGLDLFVERLSPAAGPRVTLLLGEHVGWFTRHAELYGVPPMDLVPTR